MFLDDCSESEEEEGHEEEEGLEQDKEARHFRSTLSCNLNDPAVFQRHMKAVLELELYEWGDIWNEDPFHDVEPMDGDLTMNAMWQGIPECCADMAERFARGDEPLFEGSRHKGKDMARFFLALKCKHYKMGDTAIAGMVGMMASFLPEGE